jgi:urease accessory protein
MDPEVWPGGNYRRTSALQMISNLHIQTTAVGKSTILKNVYLTTPFKIAKITEENQSGVLDLMLMSSSPGILDGDDYRMKIEVGRGSNLRLQTQSYQRLFNMKGKASCTLDVHLAEGSSFCYLPHPTVPHRNSNFTALNKIFVTEDCKLLFGEILTCGRKLNDEVFLFTKYQCTSEIYLDKKLVIKENILLEPGLGNLTTMGQFEGFTHMGSLIYLCEKADIKSLAGEISDLLSLEMDCTFGISEAPVKGLIVRMLAQSAEQLFECQKQVGALVTRAETTKTGVYAE